MNINLKQTMTVRSSLGWAALMAAAWFPAQQAGAQSAVWTNPAGGSWIDSGNWQGGTPAQGTDANADFSTLSLTADATVTLDGAQTIGNLLFADLSATHNWLLNTGTGGPLTLSTSAGAPMITVSNTTATVAVPLAGTQGLTLGGNGTLVLGPAAGYTGGTTVNGGTLNLLGNLVTLANSPLTINAGVAASAATLFLDVKQSSSASSMDVVGAGTLRFIGTTNGPTHPDLYFGVDHSGTSYYGAKSEVGTIDLGAAQRYVFAKSGHNSVARYRNNEDARIDGSIIGAGGITYIAQNNFGGSTPMEVPLVWNGANTFTGMVEIQRGSIYLFNPQALVQTNKLLLDPAAGNNARLFLYGNGATVQNLEGTSAGNALIANGNVNNNVAAIPASTLTVLQTSNTVFNGALVDSQYEYDAGSLKAGPLSLVLNGTGTLTLTGTNFYSGSTLVNGGKLVIPTTQKGGSAFTIADGAVLGVSGAGGTTVAMAALTLGANAASTLEFNFAGAPSATVAMINATNFTANGGPNAVTINVNFSGAVFTGQFPLVKYPGGTISGSGFAAFRLGSLPGYVTASLVNNPANNSLDLLITAVASPEWSGKLSSEWSTNRLAAPKNWVFITDGLTPTDFNPGNSVLFNDTATGTTTVNLSVADVAPSAVTFNNSALNYTVTGTKAIAGAAGLVTTGNGLVTLLNSNTFTGGVNLGGGTLAINTDASLGAVPAAPSPSAVIVNSATLAALNSLTLATNRGLALGPVGGAVDVTNGAVMVIPGAIGNNGGTGSLTKTGAGQLVLSGAANYTGGTYANSGTLSLAQNRNFARGATLTIASNAVVESAGLLQLIVDASSTIVDVTGGGVLRLTGTNDSATAPDLYFGPNHSGNADWGARLATTLDLGGAQRFVFGKTGHNGVGQYGLTGGDCQFGGPITGAGGLTLIAQNTYTGSPLMEVPFCFNASNSFTGPVELQRGSIYLGNPSAFPAGNVLTLNAAAGNNARFFLYGNDTTVTDLSATNAGTVIIANGNVIPEKIGPATLTVVQNHSQTFLGSLFDVQAEYGGGGSLTPTLSLTKSGAATLTLNGINTFTGPATVKAGTLALGPNGTLDGTTTIAVAPGAVLDLSASAFVLGGSTNQVLTAGRAANFGPDITGPLTSVGTINVAGIGQAGTLTVNGDFNLQGGNLLMDLAATPTAGAGVNDLIVVTGTLNISGPTTITPNFLAGKLGTGTYTLIAASAINGDPNNLSLVLPVGGRQTYTLDGTSIPGSVLLKVSGAQPASLVWLGTNTSSWDNGALNWLHGTFADSFYNGDFVNFTDGSTNGSVILNGSVQPFTVLVTNNATSYTFGGPGSLDGPATLTKAGNGKLVLATANTYSGLTLVNAGTLQIDTNGTTGSLGSGAVSNNAVLAFDRGDVFNLSNTISGSGLVQQLGTGTLLVLGANNYTGPTVISAGALQVGNDGNYGSLGTGPVTNNSVLAFDRNDSVIVGNRITGTGVVTNFDGNITLTGDNSYQGGTWIEGGRLVAAGTNALGTGPVVIDNGSLYFLFPNGSTNVVTNSIVLPGVGTQEFLIEGNPTTWTTVRLTGLISGGVAGQTFRLADTGVSGNHYNVEVFDNPSNSFAGNIQLWRGTIGFTSDGALGDPGNTIEIDLWNYNGSLRFDADNITLGVNRTITLDSGGVEPINVQGFTGTILGDLTGPGPFAKQGAGTLILNGQNDYTSTTEIDAGTLQVNGSIQSTATVTVLTNATLSGTGTVLGPVTVNGSVAPGSNSVGTLTTGAEQWNVGSSLVFTLNNATNSAGWSALMITDGLNLQAAAATPITIKLVSQTPAGVPGPIAGFNPGVSQSWPLVFTASGIANFSAAEFVVDTTAFANPLSGYFGVTSDGMTLSLTYTYVAQPPAFTGAQLRADGNFRLHLTGPAGAGFTVHASTNLALHPLTAWPVVGTGSFGAGVTTFDDLTATNHPTRFYLITTP